MYGSKNTHSESSHRGLEESIALLCDEDEASQGLRFRVSLTELGEDDALCLFVVLLGLLQGAALAALS